MELKRILSRSHPEVKELIAFQFPEIQVDGDDLKSKFINLIDGIKKHGPFVVVRLGIAEYL